MSSLIWGVSAVYLCLLTASTAAQQLWVQFYFNRAHLWQQQGQQEKFQSAMAEGLRAYCSQVARHSVCGFNSSSVSTSALNESTVRIAAGYPVNNGSWYLDLRFSIAYAVDNSTYTMPISAVSEIAAKERQAVRDATGFYMVYIGGKFYSVPPPATANQVVVPLSVLATLALVGVAFGFRHKHKDEETKLLMRERRDAAGSRNRVGASSSVAAAPQPVLQAPPTKQNGAAGRANVAALRRQEASEIRAVSGRQNFGFENSFNGSRQPAAPELQHRESWRRGDWKAGQQPDKDEDVRIRDREKREQLELSLGADRQAKKLQQQQQQQEKRQKKKKRRHRRNNDEEGSLELQPVADAPVVDA